MSAYYNEIDPEKAEWIRELIKAGVVAPGEVDERPIADVSADDVRGFTQCHWFAGIAVWSYALRRAGWPDSRPVWTGSCPCPSFSAAGKGLGFTDPRHLWPEWFRLIRECRPGTVFGEQVNAAIGHGWLDLLSTDLEAEGYAVAAAVLGAHSAGMEGTAQDDLGPRLFEMVREELGEVAEDMFREWWMESHLGDGIGFGAPHIRQRLYFVAELADSRYQRQQHSTEWQGWANDEGRSEPLPLADTPDPRRQATGKHGSGSPLFTARSEQREPAGLMADTEHAGCDRPSGTETLPHSDQPGVGLFDGNSTVSGLADTELSHGRPQHEIFGEAHGRDGLGRSGATGELGHADSQRLQGQRANGDSLRWEGAERPTGLPDGTMGTILDGFWRDAQWIWCRDGKWRPVERAPLGLAPELAADLGCVRLPSGENVFFPLQTKGKARVLRLRGYGDSITSEAAQAFIESYLAIPRSSSQP